MSTSNNLIEPGSAPAPAPVTPTMATYPARTPKVPPPHPGAIIADVLDEQGISMRKAAEAIGMSPNGLNKVLLGQSPVTPETALRIGTYFGNGPDLWLNLQRSYDLWHARKALATDLARIKSIAPIDI